LAERPAEEAMAQQLPPLQTIPKLDRVPAALPVQVAPPEARNIPLEMLVVNDPTF